MRPLHTFTVVALAFFAGCVPPPEPPHLLYDADPLSLSNPFPDARLLTADGLVLRPDWARPFVTPSSYAQVRNFLKRWEPLAKQVGGLGNFGPSLHLPSVPVDRSSLAGAFARLQKIDGEYTVLEPDVRVEHSADLPESLGVALPADYPELLLVRPALALPEESEGLLVVRRGLRAADGTPFARAAAFEAEPANLELIHQAARALDVEDREVLLALPLRPDRVASRYAALARWTVEKQVPSYVIPPKGFSSTGPRRPVGVWRSSDPDWSEVQPALHKWAFGNPASSVGTVVVGTFKSRDLRRDKVWDSGWLEAPEQAPEADLPFVLVLPAGPKPPGGHRVVLGAHGFNGRNIPVSGSRDAFCLEIAQVLAREGLGCLGIDAANHGLREGSSFDVFAFDELGSIRDIFRQTSFDLMQLARLAPTLDLDGDGRSDVSGELGFFGNSMGSLSGAPVLTHTPSIRYGVLNVPGGGLLNILVSDELRDLIGALVSDRTQLPYKSPEYYAAFAPIRAVGQVYMESGDPLTLSAGFEATGKAVLLQEGLRDGLVPNPSTEDLARAIGAEASVESISGSQPLRVLFRADPARYFSPEKAATFNGHEIFWEAAPVRRQATRFLRSKGTEFLVE